MIVYIPTPITSAEQAESLPEGTVAISEEFAPEVFVKDGDSWMGTHGAGAFTNESAVGLDALVPVEVEEEAITVQTRGQAHPDRRTRLTTPWKWLDGPSPDHRGDCA